MRLAVRRRLPDGGLGDVVGALLDETPEQLVLLPEDRGPVTISRSDVVARREVPPRAVRPSSSPADLARFFARHWRGTEEERLGGWLLRAGGGFTKRANSVLVTGDPGLPIDAACERVVEWYAERGLPARMQVLVDDTPPVGPEWRPVDDVLVLVADLRRDVPPARPVGARVVVTDTPSEDWLDLWRGGTCRGAVERSVFTSVPARYLVLHDPGPVACARLVTERRWAHVSGVGVVPSERGRGLGRATMDAALAEAREESFLGLEVEASNEVALNLYAGMGMRRRYRYRYLEHVPTASKDD